jgi:hypothetical protein
MVDELKLAWVGAFVATGLVMCSFIFLAWLCLHAVVMPDADIGQHIPLIYFFGMPAGLSLVYARWEYFNLRAARAEAD